MGALSIDRILPGCPDYPADEGAYCNDYPALLEQAEAALDRRRDAYPGMVASGQIDQQAATADIAAWEWISAEWRWIITGEGEAPPSWTLFDRIAALDLALDRVGQQRSRKPRDKDLERQQALILAMRWHLSRLQGWTPLVHTLAALTHQLRARAALPLCTTCERRSTDPAVIACTRTDCGLKQKDAA